MSKDTSRKDVESLIQDLRNMAKETYVTLFDESGYDDSEVFTLEEKMKYSRIPESLKNFQKKVNCDFELINNIFYAAFEDNSYYINNDIAWIRVKDFYYFGGWYCNESIASCNREAIKNYIKTAIDECVELYYEYTKQKLIDDGFDGEPTAKDIREEILENIVSAIGNDLGLKYFYDYTEN